MFLTGASVIVLEIALTRVFAILLWHHFAYMVVSLALPGFGAAGSLLTAFPSCGRAHDGRSRAAGAASLYALAVAGAFFIVTRIKIDSLEIWNHPANFLGLFLTFAVVSGPFLLAGLAIGGTLTCFPQAVGRLYFADLLGSALGGAAAPTFLDVLGSTPTVMAAAALGAGGGLAFAWGRPARTRLLPLAAVLGTAALFTGFSGGGLGIPALRWDIPFAPHKGMGSYSGPVKVERTLPSSTAQVDVGEKILAPPAIGGEFGDRDRQLVRLRPVTQDGTAPTAIHENASDLARFPCLDDSQAGSAYVAWKARGIIPREVLVIGCGGGIDVMVALSFGAEHVTAVDVNRAMVRMVREDFADDLGHLFDDPRVDLIHGEGRAFLRHSGRCFDIIQLSGVDTFTALSTGAYTLSESYLYTVEAVKECYEHLHEGGIITRSRFMLSWPQIPRETIRLANVVRQGIEELGVADPWRQIAVLQAHAAASTMVRKGPFTEAEIHALRRFAEDEHFMGLVFDPLRPLGGPYEPGRTPDSEIERAVREAIGLAGDLPPGTAGSPVVKHFEAAYETVVRLGLSGDVQASDAAVLALPRAFTLAPPKSAEFLAALMGHRESFLEWRRRKAESFAAAQRDFEILVRGSRAARRAFVDSYVYNLSSATDDRPFFFDYFRLDRFFDDLRRREKKGSQYHPDFPVGHLVLLSSLLQILLLAFLLILLPLRRLRRRGVKLPHRFRIFAYFAALGLGFMFVEIALMQKFVLFLGHPTHSLAVVLSGMLAFSGLGALWSSRLGVPTRRIMNHVLLRVVILLALVSLAANLLLPALLGLKMGLRIVVSLGLLAPLGFVLGLPFPLGIRLVQSRVPALVPWSWAVNGFLSVAGSLLTTLIAMQSGFTAVLVLAAVVYAAGLRLAPCSPAYEIAGSRQA